MAKKIFKFIFSGFWGKRRWQWFFDLLLLIVLKGRNVGQGAYVESSGEKWALKFFAKSQNQNQPLVIFDVGSNRGQYALMANSILSASSLDYKFYCFEPGEKAFNVLQSVFVSRNNILLFNLALGSEEKLTNLYSDTQGSEASSLYLREKFIEKEPVKLATLDNFCLKNNIPRIHWLKMDVEGYEMEVLKGAKAMLENNAVDYIQFEFGPSNIDAKVFFKDFFELLNPKYKIYRVLQDGLRHIKNYNPAEDIFLVTNFLAILRRDN